MPILRSDGAALLFVHIPKTGGSSVEAAFKEAGWTVNFLDGNFGAGAINTYRHCSPQHAHAADLEATFRIERFDAVFAFVRDPLRRMLSEYLWRKRRQATIDTSASAFEGWLRETFAAALVNPYLHDNHIRPQHEFITRNCRVYRFEDTLESGFADLAAFSGTPVPATAPRKYSGSDVTGLHSSDVEVNDNARRLIGTFYAEDYARFGYERPDA